ncbi:MAG TPA: indole-3-glycerol phosphate synthase TrpC [Epulopiscium sp.]|nr:indole-3-glycerol phosphate synthase TrpC [Candidatus Epulonipiscium sp.]
MLPQIIKNYNETYQNLEKPIKTRNTTRKSFYEAISKPGLSIIGEIKKASPSKGIIKEDFDPVKLALSYDNHVEAISVLTEESFFQGSLDYLHDVHHKVELPLLCKDFIISQIQIDMAYALGASCILLIAAILTKNQLQDYLLYAQNLGMDALVEVHTEEELYQVLQTDAKIIGINNRNLKNFVTDLNTTISLSKMIPSTHLIVSESGIYTGEDIHYISSQANINAVLVGESFMRASNVAAHAKELKDGYQSRN